MTSRQVGPESFWPVLVIASLVDPAYGMIGIEPGRTIIAERD